MYPCFFINIFLGLSGLQSCNLLNILKGPSKQQLRFLLTLLKNHRSYNHTFDVNINTFEEDIF